MKNRKKGFIYRVKEMEFLFIFFLSLIAYAASIVLNWALAQVLSIDLFGDFGLGYKFFSMAIILLTLGTSQVISRFFSLFYATKDEERLKKFVNWLFNFIPTGLGIFLIIYFVFIYTLIHLHIFELKHIASYHLAFYFLWISPLGALYTVFCVFSNSYNRVVLYAFLNKSAPLLFMLVGVVLCYLLKIELNYTSLSLLLLCTYFILNLFVIIFVRKKDLKTCFLTLLFRNKKSKENVGEEKEWKKLSFQLLASSITYRIVCLLDLLIINIILGSHFVAIYSVILLVTDLIFVLNSSNFNIINSRTSYLVETGNKKELKKITKRVNVFSISITLVSSVLLCVFAEKILLHFGEDFTKGLTAFYIVTFATAIATLCNPAVNFLSLAGGAKQLFYISALEVVLLAIFISVFTYFWGLVGAAIGSLLVTIFITSLFNYCARRLIKIKPLTII